MMGKVIDFEATIPSKTSKVICLKCYSRWIAVRPETTLLDLLECKNCGTGFVIETGEDISEL